MTAAELLQAKAQLAAAVAEGRVAVRPKSTPAQLEAEARSAELAKRREYDREVRRKAAEAIRNQSLKKLLSCGIKPRQPDESVEDWRRRYNREYKHATRKKRRELYGDRSKWPDHWNRLPLRTKTLLSMRRARAEAKGLPIDDYPPRIRGRDSAARGVKQYPAAESRDLVARSK